MDEFDLSGDHNQTAWSLTTDTVEFTAYGAGSPKPRIYKPGLSDLTFSMAGYWDAASGGDEPDNVYFGNIAAQGVLTFSAEGGDDGETAYSMRSVEASYNPREGSVGEAHSFNVDGKAKGQWLGGTIMHNATRTASGNGTARQLGSVAAGEYVYAALHVVTVSGTAPTLDVKVQSDSASGFASPTDQITFTQATAGTSEWGTRVAGAITDDWWRVNYTIAGSSPSFLFIVTIGIGI
ncbi:MAG: hypothetical protein ACE5EQ_11785 [Phycisphaerae bacterium]